MVYPRIHLALDNCFASKRWTRPDEWMQLAADMGVYYIEASADNECDPLYSTPEALQDWIDAVKTASEKTGVRVANLYSGHGTYTTLGLAHPDPRVRDHIQHDWLEPMIRNAADLGAGLGFFCHAFSQATLTDPTRYAAAETDLYDRLAALAAYASEVGLRNLSLEQMYSPHQIPWTIRGTRRMLREVYWRGAPLYITLDTGHQTGQRNFLPPSREQLESCVDAAKRGDTLPDLWLGYPQVDLDSPGAVNELLAFIDSRPYLFAALDDCDLYMWILSLGRYAPIIHLQQTDGTSSAHRPFTAKYNQTGIVEPKRLLSRLRGSYEPFGDADDLAKAGDDYPPPCQDIYLTIEYFSGTAEHPTTSLANVRESVAYWRQAVPEDGLPLDQLTGPYELDLRDW